MKVRMTLLVTGVITLGAWASAASAQDRQRFVRYVRGTDVSWGELVGETIFELSDAPYLGGQRTGESTALSAAELRVPVEPVQIFMTAFNQYFTLYPGDLIWTGTMGSTRAMQPGDTYEVEVEGVGVLRNTVVQGG